MKTYSIHGQVITAAARRSLRGLRVEAWDRDLVLDDLIGSATTDADGRFVIEIGEISLREWSVDCNPDLYFKIYYADVLLLGTERTTLWNAAYEALEVTIELADPPEWGKREVIDKRAEDSGTPASAVNHTVSGTVASPDRAGVRGLRVQIVDRNVGRDIPLAEARTDGRGRYEVRFPAPPECHRRKAKLDLKAQVYAGETLLASSDTRYDAGAEETLDIFLPAGSTALPSEYETLIEAIAAHYDGRLGELTESDERQDITYLASKTGWDARAIALAALADQLHRRGSEECQGAADIHPALYYALLRAGMPADADIIHRVDAKAAQRLWEEAIEQGVIPSALAPELAMAAPALQRRGAELALDARSRAAVSTLREMLRLALGDDPQRHQEFADLHAQHGGDPPKLWEAVGRAFGDEIASRLRLDGELGELTHNNAPLMARLHDRAPLSATLDLAQRGYHRAESWRGLLDGDVPVPDHVLGDTVEQKRARYAELLAAEVRLAFPTAVIAEMVRGDEIPMKVNGDVRSSVHAFLTQHHGKFEIGEQPVAQYLAQSSSGAHVPAAVREQIERIQRVYQITPNDHAMIGLLKNDIHSAYQIIRQEEEDFVRDFTEDLGGEETARLTYAKAQQVHGTVLNLAMSYVTARNAPALGSAIDALIIDAAPASLRRATDRGIEGASDVIAYPTLERLFDSMDYCACDHCRSVLSPAAYLVDLLFFLDHGPQGKTPLDVLRRRRPDIEQLPLTCENTNTTVPYIDLVNEMLEYFVAHRASLTGYRGHDTDGSVSADEVLAIPQFVNDEVYDGQKAPLRATLFPPPLPFHRSLETLRRLFDRLGLPLHAAMETLRTSDAPERAGDDAPYAWRDILMERLRLSRDEHGLLTKVTELWKLYGYPKGTSDDDVVRGADDDVVRGAADDVVRGVSTNLDVPRLSNVKTFTRRLGICYDELVAILGTRFINPVRELVPALERLHLPLSDLAAVIDGTIPQREEVVGWLKSVFERLKSLVTITDPKGDMSTDPEGDTSTDPKGREDHVCSLDAYELRHGALDADTSWLHPIALIRLARFIRLWKKLGWTIQETDQAITALYPGDPEQVTDPARLNDDFVVLLQRLGMALSVVDRLGLSREADLPRLLACCTQSVDDESRRWLARVLGLGARELGLLIEHTFLNPFDAPDLRPPGVPVPMVAFIQLVQALRAASLKPAQALYLVWNRDVDGRSAPEEAAITDCARTLRVGLAEVESTFAVAEDPTGEVARTRMAQVYGNEATDFFFGLLENTLSVDVDYSQMKPELEEAIVRVAGGRLAYDHFRKRLSYAGLLDEKTTEKDLGTATGATEDFKKAIKALREAGEAAIAPFFGRYPELGRPFRDYVSATTATPEQKRKDLLSALLPDLKRRRKREQVLAAVSAAARVDIALARAILGDARVLHAGAKPDEPALEDMIAMEKAGAIGPGTLAAGAWKGYLEAPENGSYNLVIESDAVAEITQLIVAGTAVALRRDDKGGWVNTSDIALTAGKLHDVLLTTTNVTTKLVVRWERKGHGREEIPGRYLYPAVGMDPFKSAYVRFLKASALTAALKLTANEAAYFGASSLIGGQGWLNALPVSGSPDPVTSVALRDVLADLLDFARIKAELAPSDERLLAVVRDPVAKLPTGDGQPLSVTGWDGASLDALLKHFYNADRRALVRWAVFRRVHDAYATLAKTGVSISALIEATTNEPDRKKVDGLQAGLRKRYDTADWLAALKSINDEMRALQRDALTAWVLKTLGEDPDPDSNHIDTPDKLFEFFLTDVQMDPCMETSRVRHAISSVQLFVERCLMNLERGVTPSDIPNASRWDWMKRYRVWEANRKVFLWPENWLEPELRDDASPFFKETMSKLLQSDITEDAAASALLEYLTNLNNVAKLEPCGIHYVESGPGVADDVAHVVARAGTERKYYYRRREHGTWTPWEQIRVDIEDEPVIPVVWRGRLLLFWLRILPQASENVDTSGGGTADGKNIVDCKLGEVKKDAATSAKQAKKSVRALLCWSEHYNNKWQPVRTSEVKRPASLGEYALTGEGAFERSLLKLQIELEIDVDSERSALRVSAVYDRSHIGPLFLLHNSHGVPMLASSGWPGPGWTNADSIRWPMTPARDGTFTILYWGPGVDGSGLLRPLLTCNIEHWTIEPLHPLQGVWDAPFFFEDNQNVFYVTTEREALISGSYRSELTPSKTLHPPPRLVVPHDRVPTRPGPVERFKAAEANIRAAISTDRSVFYDGREIGPTGSTVTKEVPR